jgi:vacuolar-type H+-ATPase subunit H
MTHPIQQVLEAERDAAGDIEAARRDAEQAVAAARRAAQATLARNETRTQRAVETYERQSDLKTRAEAQRLRSAAREVLSARRAAVEQRMDDLVEATFRAFWPGR